MLGMPSSQNSRTELENITIILSHDRKCSLVTYTP